MQFQFELPRIISLDPSMKVLEMLIADMNEDKQETPKDMLINVVLLVKENKNILKLSKKTKFNIQLTQYQRRKHIEGKNCW